MAARRRPRALASYRRKRDFGHTPEPEGGQPAKRSHALRFVVQRHDASHLHFDFRLEWGGTLKSWAVPKGPSLNPQVKRLAVEVEDHPLDYASFEGTIPPGHYGAGTVQLWDEGSWRPLADAARGLRAGRLKFELHGKRLKGVWNLIRTRREARQPQWLLIKHQDQYATMDAIEATDIPGRKPARRGGSKVTPRFPRQLLPQLATPARELPSGDGWVYEIKYDGVRLLVRVDGTEVRCITRNGQDWTRRAGPMVDELGRLGLRGCWLDGELIATDASGRSDFPLLQATLQARNYDLLRFCVFDLLYLFGEDVRQRPLGERKRLLRKALAGVDPDGPLRLADHVTSDAAALLKQVCRSRLEGLIAKQIDAPYRAGRSKTWLKLKCRNQQEFVVGGIGYLPRSGGLPSSLLLGQYNKDGMLNFLGRVGTGWNTAEKRRWQTRIKSMESPTSPFAKPPARRAQETVRWLKPKLVIEVAFTEWTRDRQLRQPVYLGVRADKDAREVTKVAERVVRQPQETGMRKLTHPGRILFADDGVTKRGLADYFETVAPWLLPHLRDRPLSVLRVTGGSAPFFHKHLPDTHRDGLDLVELKGESNAGTYAICNSAAGLLTLAQLGVVELHTWGSHKPKLQQADRLTFDLDPDPALPWARVRSAAEALRKLLQELGLRSFVKTSGGKGLHVVAPLTSPLPRWDAAKEFARSVAQYLATLAPQQFTATSGARNRRGRIFIDYLRNGPGATTVAAFSPRLRTGVPVSTPLAWEELSTERREAHFNIFNVPARLAAQRADPWQQYAKTRQVLAMKRLKQLLRQPPTD